MSGLRICAINTPFAPQLEALGHQVLPLFLERGEHRLPDLLARRGFCPDLVLHVENLGQRGLLAGLPDLPCPKVFWSVDTHLNPYWHAWYGRLYDLVLTTQAPWVERLRGLGLRNVAWLPWCGQARDWVPWAKRSQETLFVGRITPQRPSRQWMAEHLVREYACKIVQDAPPDRVVEAYAAARLAPNESILGEVNFRLFEAASAGCLVLQPQGEAALEPLFTPGVEILTYAQVLELDAHLRRAREQPDQAEAMGRAAWERVQREHLPGHRAARCLELAQGLAAAPPSPAEAHAAWWMTLALLHQAGLLPAEPDTLLRELDAASRLPAAEAARFQVLGLEDRREAALARMLVLLESGTHAREPLVNQAASAAALKFGLFDLAKRFWYRQWESGREQGRSPRWEQPASPARLHALWAGEFSRLGLFARPGLPFDEDRHLPASAVECLAAAYRLAPDRDIERRLAALLGRLPGSEHFRLGLYSHLSLHFPQDWRLMLDLGLTNLRAFRAREGLEELLAGRRRARAAGEEDRFLRALAARDPGRLALSALLAAS